MPCAPGWGAKRRSSLTGHPRQLGPLHAVCCPPLAAPGVLKSCGFPGYTFTSVLLRGSTVGDYQMTAEATEGDGWQIGLLFFRVVPCVSWLKPLSLWFQKVFEPRKARKDTEGEQALHLLFVAFVAFCSRCVCSGANSGRMVQIWSWNRSKRR